MLGRDTTQPIATASNTCAQSAVEMEAKRRILIYGINYAPEPIGVGRYTGELGSYLSQRYFDVDVVTAIPHYPGWAPREAFRNRYSVETVDGARVTRCPLLLRINMHGIWRLIAPLSFAITSAPVAIWRILTDRPDIVFCVEPTLFCAPLALIIAKLVGARTVLHVQDLEVDAAFAVGHLYGGIGQRISGWFERIVLQAFDRVVTISNRMQERLEAKGVRPERLDIVRNWVDLKQIKPLNRPSEYRRELRLSSENYVVLYAGNVGAKQGLGVMLEAAVQLAAEPNLVFVIAGDGPEKAHLVARYGHLHNVRFLPVQPERRLCELLNLADLHLLPQDRGAADLVLPSKIGGMLASGKACIVMAERGTELHDILLGSAILLPPGDSTLLAEAIVQLINQPDTALLSSRNEGIVAELDRERSLLRFQSILLERGV